MKRIVFLTAILTLVIGIVHASAGAKNKRGRDIWQNYASLQIAEYQYYWAYDFEIPDNKILVIENVSSTLTSNHETIENVFLSVQTIQDDNYSYFFLGPLEYVGIAEGPRPKFIGNYPLRLYCERYLRVFVHRNPIGTLETAWIGVSGYLLHKKSKSLAP